MISVLGGSMNNSNEALGYKAKAFEAKAWGMNFDPLVSLTFQHLQKPFLSY